MERYIGLDVHAASCTLAVVSASGRRLKDHPVETNGKALVEAIRVIPGRKHLVLEEGLQSAWLYETLRPHVEEVVVAGVLQSKGPKSDKRDAYGLAEKLRTGSLDRTVFKAPREFRLLRELSRSHITATRDLVRVQARLKSLYRSVGVPTPGTSVYSLSKRASFETQLPGALRTRAVHLYRQLDFARDQKAEIEAELLRESRKHKIVPILETAPGFGPIRSARLVPIVVTPWRFRTRQQFWSYSGLGVVTRSSSDWLQGADGQWARSRVAQPRGLSCQYNRALKAIFKGAATSVIVHRGPLFDRYDAQLRGGTRPPMAKLTLARTIAATVLRMWKDEEEYRPERQHIV